MSSDTDSAPAGAVEEKKTPAKPRRQARGKPTHPEARTTGDSKKSGGQTGSSGHGSPDGQASSAGRASSGGHGAGHPVEPPPTIRPKTKPRPAAGHANVKRVGHAEGEARAAQGGAGLTPGSHGPRRSYRTSVQTGVMSAASDASSAGTHRAASGVEAGAHGGRAASGAHSRTAPPVPAQTTRATAATEVAATTSTEAPVRKPRRTFRPAKKKDSRVTSPVVGAETVAGTAVQAGTVETASGSARPTVVAPGGIVASGSPAKAKKADRKQGRVKLNLSYVAPLSVMKMSFLLAIAVGIVFVVAVFIFWEALNDRNVFTQIDQMFTDLMGTNRPDSLKILQYVERGRVMSGAAIIAVVDVVIITVVSTLMAVIYNIIAALVGGVHVTLRED